MNRARNPKELKGTAVNGGGSGSRRNDPNLDWFDWLVKQRLLMAYLLWLIARDLPHWPRRRARLSHEEVLAFGEYLHDALPGEMRTALPRPEAGDTPSDEKQQAA